MKRPGGHWTFRRRSWQQGPTFAPSAPSLLDALDQEQEHSRDWPAWKAAYPEIFTEKIR